MTRKRKILLIAGSSSNGLAEKIAKKLNLKLSPVKLTEFNDGERQVEIERNVRDRKVYFINSICKNGNFSADQALAETCFVNDALRRASAREIVNVLPYYGYARQDRKDKGRVPISAKVVTQALERTGANRIISLDLHAPQIQGFADIPFDNVYVKPVLVPHIRRNHKKKNLVVVSPDMGGAERARAYAKVLGVGVAIIDKRRPKPGVAEVMNVIGDVDGNHCVIVDDMADTCGTAIGGADALMANGAKSVEVYCAHPVFSGSAVADIEASCIKKLIVTDTRPLSKKARKSKKIEVLSVAGLLAEVIRRNEAGKSVSKLFL